MCDRERQTPDRRSTTSPKGLLQPGGPGLRLLGKWAMQEAWLEENPTEGAWCSRASNAAQREARLRRARELTRRRQRSTRARCPWHSATARPRTSSGPRSSSSRGDSAGRSATLNATSRHCGRILPLRVEAAQRRRPASRQRSSFEEIRTLIRLAAAGIGPRVRHLQTPLRQKSSS